MLPNSRIIPPESSPTPLPRKQRRRQSISTASPLDQSKTKGFFSRLITSNNVHSTSAMPVTPPLQADPTKYNGMVMSSPPPPPRLPTPMSSRVRRKPVGGINEPISPGSLRHRREVVPCPILPTADDLNRKSLSKASGAKGFGRLFKKRDKSTEHILSNNPAVRSVDDQHLYSSRNHAIPLASPPSFPTLPAMHFTPTSMPTLTDIPSPQSFTTQSPVSPRANYRYRTTPSHSTPTPMHTRTIPHTPTLPDSPSSEATTSPDRRVEGTKTSDPSRESTSSVRKSSGYYSIYSTFGTESHLSSEDSDRTTEELAHIVASNMQRRHQTRILTSDSKESLDPVGLCSDDTDSDDDDIFVDCSGPSQEDVERERDRVAQRLSKRLSGGHFGSAGGLMLSIMSTTDYSATEPTLLKRKSPSPPVPDKELTPPKRAVPEVPPSEEKAPSPKPSIASSLRPTIDSTSESIHTEPALASTGETLIPNNLEDNFKEALSRTLDDAWQAPDLSFGEFKGISHTLIPTTEVDGKGAARRLWLEDDTFVPRERMAEWLGQPKPLNTEALVYFMDYFDFSGMRLDRAFRTLCNKLYFKAETQQIDRILEVFAKRYWDCNQSCILGSSDIVYAVVYSLLLLNTDLHVAQGNHARMTRTAFVKNTMSTICDQLDLSTMPKNWDGEVETFLKDLYASVKQHQILQPLASRRGSHPGPERRSSLLLGGRRMLDMKRNGAARKAARDSIQAEEALIKAGRPSSMALPPVLTTLHVSPSSPSPLIPIPSPLSARFPSAHRDSMCSIGSGTSTGSYPGKNGAMSPLPGQPMVNFMNTHAPALFSNQPPYLKEGVLMRKHLLECANQKSKHREWRECLVIVSQGELRMFALQNNHTISDSERKRRIRASSASLVQPSDMMRRSSEATLPCPSPSSVSYGGVVPGDSNWGVLSQPLGVISLNHTLSNILPPPGYNRQRPHVFAIQQPHGGVYLFQVASLEQGAEWVDTCNYWAARYSKEPLQGGVSNMEYGWGSCLENVILNLDTDEGSVGDHYTTDSEALNIYDWAPPVPPTTSTTLDERSQFEAMQEYVNNLHSEINEHRELRKKMMIKFPLKSSHHAKVMANWDARSKYLLHEIIKYQNYCDALEKSLDRSRDPSLLTKVQMDDETESHRVSDDDRDRWRPSISESAGFRSASPNMIQELNEELQLAF